MLTPNEQEAVRRQLSSWPKRQAHRFMHSIQQNGKPITTERQAFCMLKRVTLARRFASPELVVAALRAELTYVGVETAFRDLSAFCRQRGYIYLELLENNPEFLGSLLNGRP